MRFTGENRGLQVKAAVGTQRLDLGKVREDFTERKRWKDIPAAEDTLCKVKEAWNSSSVLGKGKMYSVAPVLDLKRRMVRDEDEGGSKGQ